MSRTVTRVAGDLTDPEFRRECASKVLLSQPCAVQAAIAWLSSRRMTGLCIGCVLVVDEAAVAQSRCDGRL